VVFGTDADATCVDVAVWIGAAPPPGHKRGAAARLWIATA